MNGTIGSKLKTLRKGRKLSQQELADKLNVTRCTISNYETNRRQPHIHELRRIAEWFGVDLSYFGVAPADEVFDLLSRAKVVFNSPEVPKEEKERLYKELMKIYLQMK